MFEKFIDNRLFTLYLFPFALGALTVVSFQPFNYSFVNFIILPLYFYFVVYIKKKSKGVYRKKPFKKNLFIFGTVFGFAYYLSGVHWITNSLTFDENFRFLIPIGLILLPLFLSLFFSLFTLIVGPYLNLNFVSIFLLSASFALSDYIRAKILTGFPWNLWVYSFSWSTEIIQILNHVGLFAFNLLAITMYMFPAVIFFNIKSLKKILYLIILLLFILSLFISGSHSLNKNKMFLRSLDEKVNVKVVSPNFDLKYNLKDEDIENRLKKLIRFSEPKNDSKMLYVWPEGVFSGYSYNEISNLKNIFRENFKNDHLILFGINMFNEEENGVYNSLIIVNNDLKIIHEYKKQKLVPFGEFLPFEKLLHKVGLKKITEGHGSFLKGNNQQNIKLENLSILPLICYEIIFTEFTQKSEINTNLIINISEDGWFGESLGPYQHFIKSVFRAVEHNTFLIRSANKGISAIINNKGEIVKKLNTTEIGNIELEIPLIKTDKKNKNDLIFFILLFTYISLFIFYKKNNAKK